MARSFIPQVFKKTNLPTDHQFSVYKRVHNKLYKHAEEETRRQKIFDDNLNDINQHNKKYQRGEKSFYLGVNQFTDLTNKEFKSFYTGNLDKKSVRCNARTYIPSGYNVKHTNLPNRMLVGSKATTYATAANDVLPESVDWRKEGCVTDVKYQGKCGSCWAFSATGSLEGQNFRQTGKLVPLSEQQLVDCSSSFGNEGCKGGDVGYAFDYIHYCGGIESDEDYPYKYSQAGGGIESDTDYPYDEKDMSCKYDSSLVKAKVTGYTVVDSGSEDALKNAVATVGPVSIAISFNPLSFKNYKGGVYDEPGCSKTELLHAVLIVGYGVDAGQDYWLVKNSHSKDWGEEGYIRMSRNKDNQCGVATQAIYPLVKPGVFGATEVST